MITKLSISVKSIMILFIIASSVSLAQNSHLETFHKLVDKEWVGHYVDSEDSHYVHKVKFEYILNGQAVKETKIVDELQFEMETYYYYDWDKEQISFLSLLNKEMHSIGKVVIDGSIFTLEGTNFFSSGRTEFKKKYEITKLGKFYDHFYRKKEDSWIRGHLIEYE